jgi:arylamine N-acetyltransferase
MANIVAIGEQKYLIDVGFGSNGPHRPIPLVHGFGSANGPGSSSTNRSRNKRVGEDLFGNTR